MLIVLTILLRVLAHSSVLAQISVNSSCGSAITSYTTSSVADSWVDGEGVAGAVWTGGTTTDGLGGGSFAWSSARSELRLTALLVVAVGDLASASISGLAP